MKLWPVLFLTVLCLSATAKERPSYGYISSNVDCRETGKPHRIKFVSQTFSYCYGVVPSGRIVADNKIFFNQAAKNRCGENYSVSFEALRGPYATGEKAEEDRQRDLTEAGYGDHVEWHASVDYESSKCQ